MIDSFDQNADEQAIRSLVQRAITAWNAGDGNAYAAVFEEDADYITFGGTHARGRSIIANEHQQLFDTFLGGSRVQLDITHLRFLSPDIAVALAVGGIVDDLDQTDLDPTRRSIQTLMLRKQEGQWHISATQITRIQQVQPGVNVPADHSSR